MEKMTEIIFAGLKNSQLYLSLREEDYIELLPLHKYKKYRAGDLIIFESLFHREIHLLIVGELEVYKERKTEPKNGTEGLLPAPEPETTIIAHIKPGECVGEFAVLSADHKGSASVRAVKDSETVRIRVEELLELCEKNHRLGFHIFRNLSTILAHRLLR
jgi:CRP-like cAMP-binding protein